MNPVETPDPIAAPQSRRWTDWLAVLFLFLATALVVVWQNSRLAVLWDLGYVLDHSYRISLGDVPYRDFPFVHAPLTFLIQAALIKLTGRVFWHTTAYCAAIGGLSTVLSWRILRNVLGNAVSHPRLQAFLLSLPLIPLGIYSVFPHPFYDPDCTFGILIAVLLLQHLDLEPLSSSRALVFGVALVIPLFVKQNTGLVFLAVAVVLLIAALAVERLRHRSIRGYFLTLAGVIVGLAVALLLIQFTAGLKNYWHWTIVYAASRRTPARADMLGVYADKMILLWLALIVVGVTVWWLNRRANRALALVSALLIATPFIWPAIYLLREQDPSERADRLLALWPVLLIVSFAAAIVTIKRWGRISPVLPFLLIGAINGALMSQQLWGSTFAIWPLFMILLAVSIAELARLSKPASWMTIPLTAVIAASLLISGGFYVRSHERLDYANLDDGEIKRSTLPQLKGLSVRGDWIPNFEELVRYTEREIPRDEGILILPGEDAFYYTTGRRPQFPVLLFDHTTNPYSPEEILKICRERNIHWLIVKQDLQNEDEQVEQDSDLLTAALEQEFEQVESLKNYDIYRLKGPEDKDDGDDDEPTTPRGRENRKMIHELTRNNPNHGLLFVPFRVV
jgi:hypothetical protein